MTVLVSHPTGNANVRALLRAMSNQERLHSFWTTIALPGHLAKSRFLGENLRRQLGRRSFPEVPWQRTRLHPLRECIRLGARALGRRSLTKHETGWASVDAVYHALDGVVADYLQGPKVGGVEAVYAFEDGARNSFRAAHERGIACLYDLPTAHWKTVRQILSDEAEREPLWLATLQGLLDSSAKTDRKDEEIETSDCVIVASSFVEKSIHENTRSRKVSVIPYGAPIVKHARSSCRSPGKPIELFYAGRMTQPKGIAYLIRALMKLDQEWRLTLAGTLPNTLPRELVEFVNDARCRCLGQIPHETLLENMSKAHVFVFPSLVDGFGLVLWEAMASGLPIIATPNTAAPDIITDGVEGFIVPIRNPDAIAERIVALYEDEPMRQRMATAALDAAIQSGWNTYEARISQLAQKFSIE